jgi:hypothetical protein
MPPSAYPSVFTIRPSYFDELPASAAISQSPPFVDGARDFNIDSDQQVRRFILHYGLTEADAATLDAHVASAAYNEDIGSAYSFEFTTRSGELIAGVRYDRGGYERSHTKVWNQLRTVRLVKYP